MLKTHRTISRKLITGKINSINYCFLRKRSFENMLETLAILLIALWRPKREGDQ